MASTRHAFLHAAVARETDDVVVENRVLGVLKRAAAIFAATAKPTALPTPWPSGPVVLRRPAFRETPDAPVSCCAAARKCLISSIGTS